MFIRKDSVKTVDEYIKDLENMRRNTILGKLNGPTIDYLIKHAEYLKHSDHEYVWINTDHELY